MTDVPTTAQRANSNDVTRGATNHVPCIVTSGQNLARLAIYRNN